ncbi:MAG TPA: hypothetical protein VN702_17435 [Acetobacteraceae bacterium]|nr:hypothetical protein [Acetobacteraceae bacterium]
MNIKSDFAILDVLTGRGALNKLIPRKRVPVTITGFITHAHGSFDGTSQEFTVDVTGVECGEPEKVVKG